MAVAKTNAVLYSAPLGRVKEYDEAVCSLLIDPIKRYNPSGRALSARTKAEAPDHVREYVNIGLGLQQRLSFYDVTSDPDAYKLLGFQSEESTRWTVLSRDPTQ